jgi:exodeoxyribonuclease V alpha subunit
MDFEHLIIDEVSMVTTELFYDFIQVHKELKKITLIGDTNQLQPINWGGLFSEIMKSQTVATYRLTTNFRVYDVSGDRDGIILNANAIVNHDPMFPFEYVPTSNFSLIEGPVERVYDIVKGCFSANIKLEQMVIITPYNRWLEVINKEIQKIYNTGARSATDSRGIIWMIGDRVMLTENDADIGVYNGETGRIKDITTKAILVDFESSGCHEFLLEPSKENRYIYSQGTAARYNYKGDNADKVFDDDDNMEDERTVKKLVHAYALTVDKSQGSEWDFVIFFIPEFSSGGFLNKNRIYTGITRTKRCCWMVVSDIDSLCEASSKSPPYRCDNLGRRLRAELPKIPPFIIGKKELAHLDMASDNIKVLEDSKLLAEQDFGFDCDD